MNRSSLWLNGSLALLILAVSASTIADGGPAAVFAWIGAGLAAAALAVTGVAAVSASRRR